MISSFPLLSPTTSMGRFLLWSKPLLYPFKKDPSFSEVSHCSLASWCLPTPGPSVLASGAGPSVMVISILVCCPAQSPLHSPPSSCTPGPFPPFCPCPYTPYCPNALPGKPLLRLQLSTSACYPARVRSPLTFLTIIRARSCAEHFLCISHLTPSMILAQRGSVTSRRSPSKPVLVQRFTQA